MEHLDLLLEPFQQAHARVVARQHAGGAGGLDNQRHELGQRPIDALRQRLHDRHVGVAIDDQRRQQIGFAVDQPIRGGVDRELLAEAQGRIDPFAPERGVNVLVVSGQEPQRDLRFLAEERAAQETLPRPDHVDDFAGFGRDVGDVRAIDPGVALAQTGFAAGRDDDGRDHGVPGVTWVPVPGRWCVGASGALGALVLGCRGAGGA